MSHGSEQAFTLTVSNTDNTVTLPRLQVVATSKKGHVKKRILNLAPLVVGKGDTCDLVIDDPKVSREHCQIGISELGVRLTDRSRNGTFIHGMRVFEALVPLNVPITVGDSTVVVEPADGPATTTITLSKGTHFGEAVGQSNSMRALFNTLERAAPIAAPILMLGESGTGKEVLAQAIHNRSGRKGACVVVDCGALPPGTIELELFGSVYGAFSGSINKAGLFEQAHNGTLFIDELGELPIELQPKLLRFLEKGETRRLGSDKVQKVDVRVIAATHRNLRARIMEGAFREDLYFRLSILEVVIPPLRDRKEDIPLLVERFLAKHAATSNSSSLTPETLQLFQAYDWPGNVRELRNMVTRAALFPELLPQLLAKTSTPIDSPASAAAHREEMANERLKKLLALSLPEAREAAQEEVECYYIKEKLRQNEGVIAHAAETMGISRQLLHRLIRKHGISAK